MANGTLQLLALRPLDGSPFPVSPPPAAAAVKAMLESGYLDRAHLPQAAQAYHGWPWGLGSVQVETWLADPALLHRILAELSSPSGASASPATTVTNPVSTPSLIPVPTSASPPAQAQKLGRSRRRPPADVVQVLAEAQAAKLIPRSKTRKSWVDYIHTETGILYSESHVYRLLKKYL
jgi:hypothetical protein